jgi:hypothetical protein
MGFMGEQTIGSLSRAAGINSITRENEETENRKKGTGESGNRGKKKTALLLSPFLPLSDSPVLVAMGRERTPKAER